jgi:hypothetical protein
VTSPSPAHHHWNTVVRLDRPRVPPATPRSTIAPPLVRDHEKSVTVVSISPADPPVASSVVTVAPLLLVSLTRGTYSSVARAGGRPSAGRAREQAAGESGPRCLPGLRCRVKRAARDVTGPVTGFSFHFWFFFIYLQI